MCILAIFKILNTTQFNFQFILKKNSHELSFFSSYSFSYSLKLNQICMYWVSYSLSYLFSVRCTSYLKCLNLKILLHKFYITNFHTFLTGLMCVLTIFNLSLKKIPVQCTGWKSSINLLSKISNMSLHKEAMTCHR